MLKFKFKTKKDVDLAVSIFFHTYMNIYTVYGFCFHVLLKEFFVFFLTIGGSPDIFFTASQACYAPFSECDPHAPAWSSFTSRSTSA